MDPSEDHTAQDLRSGSGTQIIEIMEGTSYENNPVKGRTPREGGNWWMLVLVLVVAAGIFWALGRSGDTDRDEGPVSAPADTRIAEPDRTDVDRDIDLDRDEDDGVDLKLRDDDASIRARNNGENDLDAEIRIEDDRDRNDDR